MLRSINTKIVAAFIAVFIVMSAVMLAVEYTKVREHEHALSDSMGHAAAEDCATVVEVAYDDGSGGDFVPNTRDYEYCREILRDLCQSTGMNYLYVYSVDVENNKVTYIMAVGASDDENEVISRERPYGTVVESEITDQELGALNHETVLKALEINNQFGHMLDWFSPIEDLGDNVLAGASYSITQQRQRVFTSVLNTIAPFFATLIVLLILEVIVLQRSVFKPLRLIASRMRSFSAEDTSLFEPLGIKSKDEIGDIAEAFEGMAGEIGAYGAEIKRMASEQAQAEYEMEVSRRIQQGMVPERTEKAGAGFSAYGFSRPARSVGGDFYDVLELEGGRIAVVVGDVVGKGMAAALFMSMTKTIIRDGLLAGFGPAYVLNHTNARVARENPECMFITVFACILDLTTGEVHYANAGHMPPLLIGDDINVIDVDPGELLGVFDDSVTEEATIVLKPGQGLLIYTDGVVEAKMPDGSFFGVQRFMSAMSAKLPYADAGEIVDTTVHLVDEFVAGHEQFDDLTAAALMYHGADGEKAPGVSELSASFELPCEMASFAKLRGALFATGVDEALKRKACLACEETFVNIASYSNATKIWAEVSQEPGQEPGQLRITLADNGMPFDPLADDRPEKDFAELDTGGMGINLVRQIASQLDYRREGDRNVLTIVVS